MSDGADISPISTPRSSINFAASDTSLVSPIESTFTLPPRPPIPESQPRSQIPQPVTSTNKQPEESNPPPSVRAKKENTKWNKYTGEQTTADTGLASQAPKPGSASQVEMQFPQLKERTKQILANLREKEGVKKTPWGKPPPPVAADPLDAPPVQKVPWKGASGRTAVVDPVQNNRGARKGPLQYPQRNVSRMDPAQDQARTKSPEVLPSQPAPKTASVRSLSPEKPVEPTYSAPQVPGAFSASPPKEPSIRMVPSQESIKPIAPLKVKSPRVLSPIEAQNLASLQSPFHSPHPSQARVSEYGPPVPKLKDPPRAMKVDRQSPPDTPSSRVERKPIAQSSHHLVTTHLTHEPESRFSWTTYATTVNDSPSTVATTQMDSSPVPPLPLTSSPLVIRKRPVSSITAPLPYSDTTANDSRASIISRKPVAAHPNRKSSLMSNTASKSLPPTPVEMEAGDKISTLEARLEDLERRRRNNTKITYELNESLKRNAINYDMRKRKEVEKLLTNMSMELDAITREEHEVGLTLHRSQKKKDREECYENPTGLWIKKVTS